MKLTIAKGYQFFGRFIKHRSLLVPSLLIFLIAGCGSINTNLIKSTSDQLVLSVPKNSEEYLRKANKRADRKFGKGNWERVKIERVQTGTVVNRDKEYESKEDASGDPEAVVDQHKETYKKYEYQIFYERK